MKKGLVSLFIILICLTSSAFAQSRLYPHISNKESHRYEDTLDSMFLRDVTYKFALIVKPSFACEFCLYYQKGAGFTLKKIDKNLYFTMNRGEDVSICIYKCKVPYIKVASKLDELFSLAVLTSSYMAHDVGYDGTTYQVKVDGGRMCAECWSPNEETNCYALVEIVEELERCVMENDTEGIERLSEKAESLSKRFKELIPEDLREMSPSFVRGR